MSLTSSLTSSFSIVHNLSVDFEVLLGKAVPETTPLTK